MSDSVEKRISELERMLFSMKVYLGASLLAILIVAGMTWTSIPGRARSAAEDKAEDVAEDFIKTDQFKLFLEAASNAVARAEAAAVDAEKHAADLALMRDHWRDMSLPAEIEQLRARRPLGKSVTFSPHRRHTANHDGLVFAVIRNTEAMVVHGRIDANGENGFEDGEIIAANERTRPEQGFASIVMPVLEGQDWQVSTMPQNAPVNVYWFPLSAEDN